MSKRVAASEASSRASTRRRFVQAEEHTPAAGHAASHSNTVPATAQPLSRRAAPTIPPLPPGVRRLGLSSSLHPSTSRSTSWNTMDGFGADQRLAPTSTIPAPVNRVDVHTPSTYRFPAYPGAPLDSIHVPAGRAPALGTGKAGSAAAARSSNKVCLVLLLPSVKIGPDCSKETFRAERSIPQGSCTVNASNCL